MNYALEPTPEIIEIEKKLAAFVQGAVDEGATLLDTHHPGWEKEINPHDLVMGSEERCVLGQVYGDYEHGKAVLTINLDEAWELGFVDPNLTKILTQEEIVAIDNFEDASYEASVDSDDNSVRTWQCLPVFYGLLNTAWRNLLAQRGYAIPDTPIHAIIHSEYVT